MAHADHAQRWRRATVRTRVGYRYTVTPGTVAKGCWLMGIFCQNSRSARRSVTTPGASGLRLQAGVCSIVAVPRQAPSHIWGLLHQSMVLQEQEMVG